MKHKVKNPNNFQFLSSLTSKKTYFHTWIFCCNVCNFVVPLERIFSSLYKDRTGAIRGHYIVTCIKGTELVLNLPHGTQTVRQPKKNGIYQHSSPFSLGTSLYLWGGFIKSGRWGEPQIVRGAEGGLLTPVSLSSWWSAGSSCFVDPADSVGMRKAGLIDETAPFRRQTMRGDDAE